MPMCSSITILWVDVSFNDVSFCGFVALPTYTHLRSAGCRCKKSVGSFTDHDFSSCKKCGICFHDIYLHIKLKQWPALFKQLRRLFHEPNAWSGRSVSLGQISHKKIHSGDTAALV